MKLRVLDLFSGIGGFSLGLERSGYFETIAFCEIDPFCQRVLFKHWPGVKVFNDVKEVDYSKIPAHIITGGFPCQDISNSGYREGIEGSRSCLWSEIKRSICEIRPLYAIVENVAALTYRGIDVVLSDLAEIGYDAQWHCISASALSAVHHRDRVWIIAYPRKSRCDRAEKIFFALSNRLSDAGLSGESVHILDSVTQLRPDEALRDVRKDDGISAAMDRVGAVGNTIYPEIAEVIGRAIADVEFEL